MPGAGLEPARSCPQRFLRPSRLPFRHPGVEQERYPTRGLARIGAVVSERISVFDVFKIGVGPSSSHTLGPWRAAQRFAALIPSSAPVVCTLYGSLAKTGRGHGTDVAVALGLSGEDPESIDPREVLPKANSALASGRIRIEFDLETKTTGHPNTLVLRSGALERTYYSVGGGFVQEPGVPQSAAAGVQLPFPIDVAQQLSEYCGANRMSISDVVHRNEQVWHTNAEIARGLDRIADEMIACAHRGCRTSGILPGGLEVQRRAATLHETLYGSSGPSEPDKWIEALRRTVPQFADINKWVSCFALAVNEENAAFGRVVTAPTNGAAGVIPSVLLYLTCFVKPRQRGERPISQSFLLTAGEIGSLFKKGATISAAMGGCQAEIGVSSAMAAAALTECLGGSPDQALMAAEIAMEHHLGLTCDPIGGLVQIPCIERNTMGAIKAITAANIALESDPALAKVSLDDVIRTMWLTAQDMNSKYKETSEGGLAVQIPVLVPEC